MPILNSRAVFLPYCIQKLENGRYVVLNRNYKPLGFQTTEHLKYEDYPISVIFRGLTGKKAAALSARGKADLDAIYLYDDGCIPTESAANMKKYLSRLEILANMEFADDDD